MYPYMYLYTYMYAYTYMYIHLKGKFDAKFESLRENLTGIEHDKFSEFWYHKFKLELNQFCARVPSTNKDLRYKSKKTGYKFKFVLQR